MLPKALLAGFRALCATMSLDHGIDKAVREIRNERGRGVHVHGSPCGSNRHEKKECENDGLHKNCPLITT